MTTAIRAWELSRTRRLAAMAGTLLLVAAAVWFATPAVAATTQTVAMDGTRLIPETITVKRGDFPYVCILRPGMKGTLVVK